MTPEPQATPERTTGETIEQLRRLPLSDRRWKRAPDGEVEAALDRYHGRRHASVALYDTAACTGDGCDLRETCERHLLIARRRAHVEAGGVAGMATQMAPVSGRVGEACEWRIAKPAPE